MALVTAVSFARPLPLELWFDYYNSLKMRHTSQGHEPKLLSAPLRLQPLQAQPPNVLDAIRRRLAQLKPWLHRRPTARAAALIFGWFGAGICIAAWLVLRFTGDRWWLSVPLLYGPQWIWFVPLFFGVICAVKARSRWLWGGLCCALLMVCHLLGVVVSLPRSASAPLERRIKVLTANLGGAAVSARLLEVIIAEKPDVICLQENSASDVLAALERQSWNVYAGRGIAIASQYPILNKSLTSGPEHWFDVMARCDLETPGGVVHFFTIHLPTPRHEIEDWIDGRLSAERSMKEQLAARDAESLRTSREIERAQGPKVVAGDFNLVALSGIYREHWASYSDAYAEAATGCGWTKFTRWWGVRIDHVLTSPHFRAVACRVGPDVGSDHRPVIAELEWRIDN